MLKIQLIGNLGADAELREQNGNKFVTFRVAHTESYTKSDGTRVENTTWVSCVLNGDGGALTQYLVKGTKVYVDGDASFEVYSSPKTRRMECGVRLSVRNVELVGGKSDLVPARLLDANGRELVVSKAYYTTTAQLAEGELLHSRNGSLFTIADGGWIVPVNEQQNQTSDDGKAF